MPFINYNGKNINFIHIPKTGGTTVEAWLREHKNLYFHTFGLPLFLRYTPQHFTYADLKSLFGDTFFDYSFVIVRNPYDRLESEYRMQYIVGKQGFFKGFETFQNWVERSFLQVKNDPNLYDNHLRPQWEFVSKSVKQFKFEYGIENIIDRVASDTGLPKPTSTVLKEYSSEKFDGVIKWDIKEIEIVRNYYRRDFELFGYKLDKQPG